MNIHEYQAKDLLRAYAIPTERGLVCDTLDDLDACLDALPQGPVMIKAQIHAGGRGKGRFKDGLAGGGVQRVPSKAEVRSLAQQMLGKTLITQQTGEAGRVVRHLYLTEAVEIAQEYYLAMLLDRRISCPIWILSAQGGTDIETLARTQADAILTCVIDPALGPQPFQFRQINAFLGIQGESAKALTEVLRSLYRLFCEKDAALLEINPLIRRPDDTWLCLDAKLSFDDNALYRQDAIRALRDEDEEDPKEIQAHAQGLSYIALDGTIACMVNGAGLAMATMDIIQHYGGSPANFLDVGGGASEEQVKEAFRIILQDTRVEVILINIFGGIMRCDVIAKGIVQAAQELSLRVPLVVRLEGTAVQEGRTLLNQSKLKIETADTLAQAAQKAVACLPPKSNSPHI